MNNWKLRSTITGKDGMDFVEVNGHLACYDQAEDCLVQVVPFGDKYPFTLRTSASDDFGPVSNQVPGICNGTFTHTGSGSATVAATTLTGEGSGATFTYTFLADGTLSTIVAATGGSNYLVGDKLRITTSASHGSQVIEFRLVDGSNARSVSIRLIHDQGVLPYPVHRVKITETDEDHTIQVLDYRSSQVFPKPQDKLLDKYPDAAAAYGLRLLRSAYLGPAIKVRRDSDNATKDIGFSGGNLDTATLLAFAGSQTVTVDTWYDQSGGGNDATQSTNASQPTIVNGGVLSTVNSKPALDFDGSDDKFSLNHSDLYDQDRFDAYMHYQTDDNKYIIFNDGTQGGKYSFDPIDGGTGTNLSGSYDIDGTQPTLYVNGVQSHLVKGTDTLDELHTELVTNGAAHSNGAIVVHEAAGTQDWTNLAVSAYTGFDFNGKMTEMVIYTTDQSANREDIEKDMALHSGAFQVEDAPLLDAYGGAHAAYSLRKLNSDYTGAAIRAVSVTGSQPYDEQDIGFDSDGKLDLAALSAFAPANCTIKTWYDQSGNGNDLTQTSISLQPRIQYTDGTTIKVGNDPALRFESTADAFSFDSTGLDVRNLSSFMVMKLNVTTGTQFPLVLSTGGSDRRFYPPYVNGGNFIYVYGDATALGTQTADKGQNLHTMIAGATQGDAEAFFNGVSKGTKALATAGVDNSFSDGVGRVNGANNLDGFIQEIVVYSSDQSERREGIERNISNHYDL